MSGWQSRFKETFQSDWIMPPMQGATAGIAALAVTSTAVTVDLTTAPYCIANTETQGQENYNPNPLGHYLSLQADGGDVYIAFGDTVAHLSGVTTTSNATVASNVITLSANDTIKIPNGQTLNVKLPGDRKKAADSDSIGKNSPARFLAYLTASGTATLRMWQSSP